MRYTGWRRLSGDTAARPDLIDLGKRMLGELENRRRLGGPPTSILRRQTADGSLVTARFVGGIPSIDIQARPTGGVLDETFKTHAIIRSGDKVTHVDLAVYAIASGKIRLVKEIYEVVAERTPTTIDVERMGFTCGRPAEHFVGKRNTPHPSGYYAIGYSPGYAAAMERRGLESDAAREPRSLGAEIYPTHPVASDANGCVIVSIADNNTLTDYFGRIDKQSGVAIATYTPPANYFDGVVIGMDPSQRFVYATSQFSNAAESRINWRLWILSAATGALVQSFDFTPLMPESGSHVIFPTVAFDVHGVNAFFAVSNHIAVLKVPATGGAHTLERYWTRPYPWANSSFLGEFDATGYHLIGEVRHMAVSRDGALIAVAERPYLTFANVWDRLDVYDVATGAHLFQTTQVNLNQFHFRPYVSPDNASLISVSAPDGAIYTTEQRHLYCHDLITGLQTKQLPIGLGPLLFTGSGDDVGNSQMVVVTIPLT